MDIELLYQSAQDILDTAEAIIAFASALVGFLGGWFGRKRKEGNRKSP